MDTQTTPKAAAETEAREELIQLIVNAFHRTIVHYAHWWTEVEAQTGLTECLAIERDVWSTSFPLQMRRLGRVLGFEVGDDGVPTSLRDKSSEELRELLEALSVNWLASDGIWFQTVEQRHGMTQAKSCNDAAWGHFSPFEAECIRARHKLPDGPPLLVLASALHHRLYAHVNSYTIEHPDDNTLILRMNDCRVQSARKRKGLDDYPCKSGGIVEYSTFASTIDPQIRTECLGCPPDAHPDEWYCAWRFTV